MNRAFYFLIVFLGLAPGLRAQTHHVAVLVLGNGNAAWSAGLQSAVSGVKTTILFPQSDLEISFKAEQATSGIAAQFQKRLQADRLLNRQALLKKWADSTANLQILRQTTYTKISRSGSNWVLRLSNGQTLKAKVLVHADPQVLPGLAATKAVSWKPLSFENTLYRTSLATGDDRQSEQAALTFLALSQLQTEVEENFVELKDLSSSMAAGQAAGALAAYAAFFKTTTAKANLKSIQGELLQHKQALIPLTDVQVTDLNWRAIQVVALTGTMPLKLEQGKALFQPEAPALLLEVKTPLTGLFYKTPIWFADHANAPATLAHCISLICYLGNRSVAQVSKEVSQNWEKKYHFTSAPAEEKVLSRRQLAVLIQEFLNPFGVNVDLTGRIIK